MSGKRDTTFKKNKNEKKPSKPEGPFCIFQRSIIDDLRKQHPEEPQSILAKYATEEWINLSENEVQKFQDLFNKKMTKYQSEMLAWKKKDNYLLQIPKQHLDNDKKVEFFTQSQKGVKRSKKAEDRSSVKAFKDSKNSTREKSTFNKPHNDSLEQSEYTSSSSSRLSQSYSETQDDDQIIQKYKPNKRIQSNSVQSFSVDEITQSLSSENYDSYNEFDTTEQLWKIQQLDELEINIPFTFDTLSPSFEQLRWNKCSFVDRSLLIKTLLKQGSCPFLITQPRRTGKTVNLQMLQDFFKLQLNSKGEVDVHLLQKKRTLFFGNENGSLSPLKISEVGDLKNEINFYFGKYPTLMLSLQDIGCRNEEQLVKSLKLEVKKQFIQHRYLIEKLNPQEITIFTQFSDGTIPDSDINYGFPFLISILRKKYQEKVIVLVDDYDKLFSSLISQENPDYKFASIITNCITNFLLPLCKPRENDIQMLVLTGIFDYLVKDNIGLNNLLKFDVSSYEIEGYYGLSKEELIEKLESTFQFESPAQKCDMIDHMQSFLNGSYGNKDNYYNIWSVFSFLSQTSYQWEMGKRILLPKGCLMETENVIFLISLLKNCGFLNIKKKIIELVRGTSVELKLSPNASLFQPYFQQSEQLQEEYYTNFLLSSGYITSDRENLSLFKILNKEIQEEFTSIIKGYLKEYIKVEILKPLFQAIYDQDKNGIERNLKIIFVEKITNHKVSDQSSELKSGRNFHNLILGMLLYRDSNYLSFCNTESGYGKADIILLPKDQSKQLPGFVMEFKVLNESSQLPLIVELESKANEGKDQILTKRYCGLIEEYNVKECVVYSIAFHKDHLKIIKFTA